VTRRTAAVTASTASSALAISRQQCHNCTRLPETRCTTFQRCTPPPATKYFNWNRFRVRFSCRLVAFEGLFRTQHNEGQSSGHKIQISGVGHIVNMSHVTVDGRDGRRTDGTDHFYPNWNQDYSGIVFLLSLLWLVGVGVCHTVLCGCGAHPHTVLLVVFAHRPQRKGQNHHTRACGPPSAASASASPSLLICFPLSMVGQERGMLYIAASAWFLRAGPGSL